MRLGYLTSFLVISLILLPASAYRMLGIFSYSGTSHFMMYGRLLRGLAERGHQVDVMSYFPPKKPIPNYNQIVDLTGSGPIWRSNITYSFIKTLGEKSIISMIATTLGGDLCDFMERPGLRKIIENPPRDPPYDVIITDVLGAPCYIALGKHLKVPVVGVVSSALWPWVSDMVANPDNPSYVPDVLSGLYAPMNFWERLMNTVWLIQKKWEFNHYTANQDEKIQRLIGPHALSVREAERNISLILVNSHYSLNGVRPYTAAVVEVGGLHIEENVDSLPEDLERWLSNSDHGFVYISFGAMAKIESFPRESLKALYSSLAKLSPIRVLVRIANSSELLPGLPDNVLTRPWIPQLTVLKQKNIRAFVTHGGLMGTQEAVYCGVPMIGVPLFGDQMQNIKLYVRYHVAVSLNHNELTEENWDAAFNAVLRDPSYKEAAKKLSIEFRDRPMTAMDTAAYWVEYVIRHGGANLRSPAMDLTWWQIALLDVYGSLLLAAIVALSLLNFFIKKLIAILFKSTNNVDRSKKFN